MLFRSWTMTLLLAVLSLGFLGQSPSAQPGNRRHISSCDGSALPSSSLPLASSLFSFVQTDAAVQAAQSYQMFLMSMQINMALNPFARPSTMGFGMPAFPNFAVVEQYVAPTPVPASGLAWHGLMQDPQLQYLVHPTPSTGSLAATGSLDALVNLPSIQTSGALNFTVGNSTVQTLPAVAAPMVSASGNQISRL